MKVRTRKLIAGFRKTKSAWLSRGGSRRDLATLFRGAKAYTGSKIQRMLVRHKSAGVMGFPKPRKIVRHV